MVKTTNQLWWFVLKDWTPAVATRFDKDQAERRCVNVPKWSQGRTIWRLGPLESSLMSSFRVQCQVVWRQTCNMFELFRSFRGPKNDRSYSCLFLTAWASGTFLSFLNFISWTLLMDREIVHQKPTQTQMFCFHVRLFQALYHIISTVHQSQKHYSLSGLVSVGFDVHPSNPLWAEPFCWWPGSKPSP